MYLLGFIFFLCLIGFLAALYNQLIKPFVDLKISEIEYPPEVGAVFEFVMGDMDRFANFTVGANTGDLITKSSAISENHLTFQFKKDAKGENYLISVKKDGATLFKPPRMTHYGKMSGTEKMESHEIIGKSADFRISNKIVKDRMIEYIEIGLTAKFFFDKLGRERMKFFFAINKVHPGFNLKVKNSKGLFAFGKDSTVKETTDYDTIDD